MHEMSVACELLKLAQESAAASNCAHLQKVIVHCGQLAGIVPDALQLAFQCLIAGTPHADATLEVVIVPLKLKCPLCGHIFDAKDSQAIYGPCPACKEEFAHMVLQGRELILARIEAIP